MKCVKCFKAINNNNYISDDIPRWRFNKDQLTLIFCSSECYDNSQYFFSVFCYCGVKIDKFSPEPIQIQILNGFIFNTLFFCDEKCYKHYRDTGLCQSCKKSGTNGTLVNGYKICSDNKDHPSCIEKYTGEYTCSICKKNKNILHTKCSIFTIDNIEFDEYFHYICHDCYKPVGSLSRFTTDNWRKIIDGRDYENILTILKKYKMSQFICNKCEDIKSIIDGINIIENQNLCNNCI